MERTIFIYYILLIGFGVHYNLTVISCVLVAVFLVRSRLCKHSNVLATTPFETLSYFPILEFIVYVRWDYGEFHDLFGARKSFNSSIMRNALECCPCLAYTPKFKLQAFLSIL